MIKMEVFQTKVKIKQLLKTKYLTKMNVLIFNLILKALCNLVYHKPYIFLMIYQKVKRTDQNLRLLILYQKKDKDYQVLNLYE